MDLRIARRLAGAALICLMLLGAGSAASESAAPKIRTVHGLALYGEPKYGAGFTHLDYVNPNAPKGGTVRFSGGGTLSAAGTYDSFNPFSPRGVPAINIINLTLLYDRLMEPSFDELQSQYGMIAESVTYPTDYAWAEYKIRPNARWHDGTPITAEDVVLSYEITRDKGTPAFAYSIQDVASAAVVAPRTVRFTFKGKNNRRSLISLGLLTIVPKHYWQSRDFSAPVIVPPLTSGPYKISSFELGHSVTLERLPDYWGKDVPINVGRFNFDKIIYQYYRDPTVAFEGFKTDDTDIRFEASQKLWATAYIFPALARRQVVRDVIAQQSGFNHQAYYFNLRRDKFKDPVLREALGYAFDFTWMNKNLFYGSLVRSENYFGYPGSELAAKGLPTSAELALLEPYRKQLPPRVFTQPVHLPDTDGTQAGLRNNLRTAAKLLSDAGYTNNEGKLRFPKSDTPVEFEIM
ncbi:MAG: extracellular solute-binding protein, partial [Alphaproteobacteria bacterium]